MGFMLQFWTNNDIRSNRMAAPRKENIKEIILDATCTLLETRALADISLADIAAAAGISKGTLYYHYKTKGEIFFDITDRYLAEQWGDFIRWTENKEKDTSPHRLVNYVIERNIASSALRLHLIDAALLGDEEIRLKLVKRYGEFQKLISEKIAERTTAVSADYITWLILMVSDGIIVQNSLKNEAFDTQAFLKQSTEYIKRIENKD